MLRKLAVSLAAVGALSAAQVKALGLGEVTVHSALNQPLNAEIELLQLRDLTSSQVVTSLADSDEFYLAGVKPTAILSDFNFQLDIKNGQGIIRVTSRRPVREPFLNFLVEVNWPSGRLVREYTLLLDPPVFSPRDLAPAPVVKAAISAPKPPPKVPAARQPIAPPRAAASLSPEAVAASTPSVRGGAKQVVVDVHDTLWDIALKHRPDRRVSPQQMMLAIQKENPDAFVNNNINRLRSGVVLKIPGKEQLYAMSSSDPLQEVKRQNQQWKSKPPATKKVVKSEQLDASRKDVTSAPAVVAEESPQLRIIGAEEDAAAADKSKLVSSDTSGRIENDPLAQELLAKNLELEEQLVVTLEGLDKVERDNSELFDRLERLSDQMESMQRLLLLKDQEMAELQQKALSPEPEVVSDSFLAALIDSVMKSPAVIGAGAAALLAALGGLLLWRRRQQVSDDDEQAVEDALAILDAQENAKAAGGAAAVVAGAAVASALSDDEDAAVSDSVLPKVDATIEDPDDPFNLASEGDLLDEDFSDLTDDDFGAELDADLDMDLKIDEPIDEDPEMAEFAQSLLADEEYDLSVDEEPAAIAEPETDDAGGSSESDAADLEFDVDAAIGSMLDQVAPATELSSEEDPLDLLDSILGESRSEQAGVDDSPDAVGRESSAESAGATAVNGATDSSQDDVEFVIAESGPKPDPLDEDETFQALLESAQRSEKPVIDAVALAVEDDDAVLEDADLDALFSAADMDLEEEVSAEEPRPASVAASDTGARRVAEPESDALGDDIEFDLSAFQLDDDVIDDELEAPVVAPSQADPLDALDFDQELAATEPEAAPTALEADDTGADFDFPEFDELDAAVVESVDVESLDVESVDSEQVDVDFGGLEAEFGADEAHVSESAPSVDGIADELQALDEFAFDLADEAVDGADETAAADAEIDFDAIFAETDMADTDVAVSGPAASPEPTERDAAAESAPLEAEASVEDLLRELALDAGEDEQVQADGALSDSELALSLDGAADGDLEAELSRMLELEDGDLVFDESGATDEAEVDYLDAADEVGTKLDLARAYIDMEDADGARDILQEVVQEGSESQVREAQELLSKMAD